MVGVAGKVGSQHALLKKKDGVWLGLG